MVAIPSFQGVPRMKGIRHCRCGPRPHLLGSIVERPDDCLRRQVCVEGDDIPNGAHPSIRPARRSEERLLRILEDFRSLQCDEALAFHRSPVWLTLRSEERPTVIRDLERDPHAKEYLSVAILTGCAWCAECQGCAEERWPRRGRSAGDENLRC